MGDKGALHRWTTCCTSFGTCFTSREALRFSIIGFVPLPPPPLRYIRTAAAALFRCSYHRRRTFSYYCRRHRSANSVPPAPPISPFFSSPRNFCTASALNFFIIAAAAGPFLSYRLHCRLQGLLPSSLSLFLRRIDTAHCKKSKRSQTTLMHLLFV